MAKRVELVLQEGSFSCESGGSRRMGLKLRTNAAHYLQGCATLPTRFPTMPLKGYAGRTARRTGLWLLKLP